jgi:hypothetical protein
MPPPMAERRRPKPEEQELAPHWVVINFTGPRGPVEDEMHRFLHSIGEMLECRPGLGGYLHPDHELLSEMLKWLARQTPVLRDDWDIRRVVLRRMHLSPEWLDKLHKAGHKWEPSTCPHPRAPRGTASLFEY